jgi:hypothetical protein
MCHMFYRKSIDYWYCIIFCKKSIGDSHPILFPKSIAILHAILEKVLAILAIAIQYCNINNPDLHKLCKWSEEWLMLFNVDKCKVQHAW